MTIDTSTVALITKIVALDPSWTLVILVLGCAILYLIINLFKNTTLTKEILSSVSGHKETAEVIKEIRADQKISNSERKLQGIQIQNIELRLGKVETDIHELKNQV
jgi:hypothetical protein